MEEGSRDHALGTVEQELKQSIGDEGKQEARKSIRSDERLELDERKYPLYDLDCVKKRICPNDEKKICKYNIVHSHHYRYIHVHYIIYISNLGYLIAASIQEKKPHITFLHKNPLGYSV